MKEPGLQYDNGTVVPYSQCHDIELGVIANGGGLYRDANGHSFWLILTPSEDIPFKMWYASWLLQQRGK